MTLRFTPPPLVIAARRMWGCGADGTSGFTLHEVYPQWNFAVRDSRVRRFRLRRSRIGTGGADAGPFGLGFGSPGGVSGGGIAAMGGDAFGEEVGEALEHGLVAPVEVGLRSGRFRRCG